MKQNSRLKRICAVFTAVLLLMNGFSVRLNAEEYPETEDTSETAPAEEEQQLPEEETDGEDSSGEQLKSEEAAPSEDEISDRHDELPEETVQETVSEEQDY